MEYHKTITLKDGRACTLRNGTAEDGQALLKIFNLIHTQTDYLLTYPEEDECCFEDEAMWLQYDPVSIARQSAFERLQVFLDDGKDDEGQLYRACEKLFGILQRNGADVQVHLFAGRHNGEYVLSNLDTYLRFYNG